MWACAVVAGKINFSFTQLYQQNQPQLQERHDAHFLEKNQTSLPQWCADIQRCSTPQFSTNTFATFCSKDDWLLSLIFKTF
jgi:hypothetical protein